MKKWVIGVALVSMMGSAQAAEGPNWDSAGFSYISSDLDGDVFDGFGVSLSKGLGEHILISTSYATQTTQLDIYDVEINAGFDTWDIGLGYRYGLTDSTDLYGKVNYEYEEADINVVGFSEKFSEDGYTVQAGVRSMVTDKLELNGDVAFEDFDGSTDTIFTVGLMYYLVSDFGVGAAYSVEDNVNTYALTAAVFF